MRIELRIQEGIVIITPRGRLTVETEAAFSGALRRLIETGYARIVLDLADVPSIDGIGLGALARAAVAARGAGGELALLNLTPRNRLLLTITGLTTALRAYDSERAAVLGFGARPHPARQASSAETGVPASLASFAADGSACRACVF